MDITDYNWTLLAANVSHKQALFDYAQESGVLIGDAGEGWPPYRDDEDLAISYGPYHGLLSYPEGQTIAIGRASQFTTITPAQFLEMCDAYYHQPK